MTLSAQLRGDAPGIVAILRGVQPDQVVGIARALIDADIRIIEIPLNSPQPLASIERLVASVGEHALIGAGTVLSANAVDAVAAAGGRLIVSPNTDPAVIGRTLERGLDALPGAMTPTEAFAAIAAGARHIKLFPGGSTGPKHLRALREVLPTECSVWAVGGVNAANLTQWLDAGAGGVGVGGSLYQPGSSAEAVRTLAVELVAAWRTTRARPTARSPVDPASVGHSQPDPLHSSR
ncbi:MAG: 2-dehydro-3-deoxy-6-phosphogalactonate aldolase [Steroidobacteraceae bacterium]